MADVSTTIPGASMAHTIHSGSSGTAAGAGMGLGGLALGGIGGLVLGALLNNNGNGLFGGNNDRTNAAGGALLAMEGLEAINEVGRDVLSTSAATQTAVASSNLTTLQSVNSLGSSITAANTQNLITNLQSFNTLGSALTAGFAASQAVSNTNFSDLKDNLSESAQSQLLATINGFNSINASLQAQNMQQAECCCQIKQAISADGQATRALINDIRIADLQAQLNDAKFQVSQQTQTNQILAALGATPSIVRTAAV